LIILIKKAFVTAKAEPTSLDIPEEITKTKKKNFSNENDDDMMNPL